ncbi:hypothetical protein Vretifemale_1655 [Volvox reticuliferus]|uniref:Uncharacterized protein n=1 Tax=Volvox reticuliferus TaxID=1737510 RepID=A0A8J4FHF9_9CHLO|nr:hypothetical protein Vretifemale_1655 [Volvox reticuliferus]
MATLQVEDKLLELSSNHTASQVIQFFVKYAGDIERRTVMDEASVDCCEAAQLLRQPYGANVILDLYGVASKIDRNTLRNAEFYSKAAHGNCRQLNIVPSCSIWPSHWLR